MQKFKSMLLGATIVAGLAATPLAAQTTVTSNPYLIDAPGLPADSITPSGATTAIAYEGDTALHIAGATSIQKVLVRVMNCLGSPKQLGNSGAGGGSAGFSKITPITYAGQTGSLGNVALTCNNSDANVLSAYSATYSGTAGATYEVQPQDGAGYGFAGKYVGTGSGFGRNSWKFFADLFDGSTQNGAGSVATGVHNPFNDATGATDGRWKHLQAAFSDTPLSQAELATYTTNAAPKAGPAIQVPIFVLPVAIAYSTQYGIAADGTTALNFNPQFHATVNAKTIPSIRLTTQAYCGIFNGDITNWNDATLTALNKKVLLGDVKDTLFKTLGAPIRLVGRMDGSGTTNVFTRHLSTVCSNTKLYTPKATAGANKFSTNSDYLPYNKTTNGAADFTTVRTDTKYGPNGSGFAGNANAVSGDYYKGGSILNIGTGTPTGTPTTGYAGTGLFTLANGGGDLSKTLALTPDYQGKGTGDSRKLSGWIGYISADFVQPSTVDAPGTVVAASLGYTGAPFVYPSYTQGLKAFGTILPPETDATGVYTSGADTRQVATSTTTTGNATRSNPTAWTDVLYADATNTLAAPTAGYPMTGTTQVFTYTCFATAGNREAIAELLGTLLGQVKKDAAGHAFAAGAFGSTNPTWTGIVDQSNLGIVPKVWQTAIANTFLNNTNNTGVDTSGSLNLWIQDTVVPGVKAIHKNGAITGYTVTATNPNTTACTATGGTTLPGA